jgi:Tol biopolymer transport system component
MRVAVCCSLAFSLGGPSPADAAVTAQRDRSALWLAFVSDHLGPPTAITSLSRNGDLQRLTSSDRDEAYPCDPGDVRSVEEPRWSPDGSMLSFVQVVVTSDVGCEDSLQTEYRLIVMDADGSDERSLAASQAGITQAGWAPDGSSLYYTIGNPHGLWSVGLDGSAPEQVNTAQGWQQVSPSGDRVAIIALESEADQTLLVAAIDGSGATEIGPIGPFAYGENLRWSPDGEWIAAIRRYPDKVLLVRSDGSERRVVWRGQVFGLDFSANGGKLVLAKVHLVRGGLDLWVLDLASGSIRNVTQTDRRGEAYPAWRPPPAT